MSDVIDPAEYLTEAEVLARWPLFSASELKLARERNTIAHYAFRRAPGRPKSVICYTPRQILDYLAFRSRHPHISLKTTPAKSGRGGRTRYGKPTVYFIKAGLRIKIGYSMDPAERLIDLQTGCPDKLELIATMPGTMKDENRIKQKFEHYRIDGEWFERSAILMKFIEKAALANTPAERSP